MICQTCGRDFLERTALDWQRYAQELTAEVERLSHLASGIEDERAELNNALIKASAEVERLTDERDGWQTLRDEWRETARKIAVQRDEAEAQVRRARALADEWDAEAGAHDALVTDPANLYRLTDAGLAGAMSMAAYRLRAALAADHGLSELQDAPEPPADAGTGDGSREGVNGAQEGERACPECIGNGMVWIEGRETRCPACNGSGSLGFAEWFNAKFGTGGYGAQERRQCARCGRVGLMLGHASIGDREGHYCHDSSDSCYVRSQHEGWPELRAMDGAERAQAVLEADARGEITWDRLDLCEHECEHLDESDCAEACSRCNDQLNDHGDVGPCVLSGSHDTHDDGRGITWSRKDVP
jgi:hypothetical protein